MCNFHEVSHSNAIICQVFCRIRPLNKTEEKNGDRFLPKFPSEDTISIGVSSRCLRRTSAAASFSILVFSLKIPCSVGDRRLTTHTIALPALCRLTYSVHVAIIIDLAVFWGFSDLREQVCHQRTRDVWQTCPRTTH